MPQTPAAIRAVYERNLTPPATGIDWRSPSGTAGAEIVLPGLRLPAPASQFMAGGIYEFSCSGRWAEATTEGDTTWRVYYQEDGQSAVQLFGFVCTDTWPDSNTTIYPVDSHFEATFRIRPHDHDVQGTGILNRLSCKFEWFLDRAPGGTSIVTTTLGEHHVDPDGSGSVITQQNGPSFSRFRAHKFFNDVSGGNGQSTFAAAGGRLYVTFEKEVTSTLVEVYNAAWLPLTHDRAN